MWSSLPVQGQEGCGTCVLWLGMYWCLPVACSHAQSHTGDFRGKVVMGSSCTSLLHAWAVLLEGMKWPRPCCLLPHWSSDWHSSCAAEVLWEQRWLCSPSPGTCSSSALHYPAVSASLCQTRNKVSSCLPGVLATQRRSQDSSCSEQEPGRSFECRRVCPAALPHMLRVSVCLSSFPQRLLTQPSDREGISLVWIQKLWLKPPPVAVKS